jgi:DNA-binding LacI/PurR family transcriptional regulator
VGKSSRVTIDEIARRADVSISTVSRVLNGLNRVHPQTRQRVLELVHELRYQPSALARDLAIQQTQTLGFVIPTLSDPFYFEIVRRAEEAAASLRHNLPVVSQLSARDDQRYLQLFNQRRVDSMVLVGIAIPPEELARLVAQGFPVAFLQQDVGEGVFTFLADNYGGARALADHLLNLGCRRIAYIAGSDFTCDNAERLRGLKDALAARGLSLPEPYIAQGDYYRKSGYQAMVQLPALNPPPEAVFAANDQMALDAMLALRDRGLRVPEDIPWSALTISPRLATSLRCSRPSGSPHTNPRQAGADPRADPPARASSVPGGPGAALVAPAMDWVLRPLVNS